MKDFYIFIVEMLVPYNWTSLPSVILFGEG